MRHHSVRPDRHAGAAQPRPTDARRLRLLVLGLGALAVVAVIAGTSLSLWRMHEDVIQRAEGHLLDVAQILGEQTLRSTHAVDAVLSATAEDARRSAIQGRLVPSEALHLHLKETIAATSYVRALRLTDAAGAPMVDTEGYPPPRTRDDISASLRTPPEDRTPQFEPVAPGDAKNGSGRSISMSRRLIDAQGRIFGVITAFVDPAYFLWPLGLQELGPEGMVRLLRRDGTLLTGYPMSVAAATGSDRDSGSLIQSTGAGPRLIYLAASATGGARVSAVYPVEGYPLLISVSTPMQFIVTAWQRSAWLFGSIAAIAALLFVVITLSLARQLSIDEELKAAVVESEQRLQAIIQSAMDAIIIVDADERIVLFNAAAEQIFGCADADALGVELGRFIPGQSMKPRTAAGGDAGNSLAQKTGEHLALSGKRADGREFPIDASISQARLHGVDHFIVILRDVTERRQAEAALRENERRYRTLFSHAMDGILLLDAEGNIVDVNGSFARMHGYTTQALLGMNLRHLDTPEALNLAPERIRRILQGEAIGFEVEHFHQDGHILPLDVATSAIDIDGKMYILAFHRDITERRLAEQELRRSQRELRGLSRAANEALEAERRRTARELHDELGQSLTALKMDLESLRSALPPGQPELGQRALAMHALLDGTIAATRRIASDLRPLMLDDLGLAAALDWLTKSFSKHSGIVIDLVIDDAVAQVREPIASALYRITQESLTNIAKYAKAGSAEIRLEHDKDWVELSVRDNGRGIEAADQHKLGTFGLRGIRERVSLLGGNVVINGKPGQGTEVRARVPLAAADAQEAEA